MAFKKSVAALLLLLISASALLYSQALARRQGLVHWVIDGDTFELETGERIRLIGINSPEYQPWKNNVEPYGRQAWLFTKSLLSNQRVFLESDTEKKDKYGRTLAYVYLANGGFVNQLLVEEGLAEAKYYSPNGRYFSLLKKAEEEAVSQGKGMWENKKSKSFLFPRATKIDKILPKAKNLNASEKL